MSRLGLAAIVPLLLLAVAWPVVGPAAAAELKVVAGGSMTAVLGELGPSFERESGHRVVIQFGSTPQLIRQVVSGAAFDLGVVPVDVMKDAGARARFAAGPTIDVARVGFGVAARAGAPKPDIGSPAALKAALLGARSIAYLPESAAGAYVTSVFQTLGIAEEMKAKTRAQADTAGIARAVAAGEAELGVFLTNVLIGPGVELVGPFPPPLQQDLVFTAAVAAGSGEQAVAEAFIRFLKSPAAIEVLRARGVSPG